MKIDLGKILTRAWQIIWNHKVLWVFGILAGFAGGSGGSGNGGGSDYDQNGTSFATGISTINSSSPDGTRQGFVAVPSAVGPPPAQAIVWGGNFLYFKDGDGLRIGRTKADGTGRSMDIFPTLMTGGYVHHISPALASTVTVTTTTTTSSTTTSSSTTSSTTTTVAAA
ncbi:MAG: hypothetical protein FGM36_16185, partial [Burkholderiaceae bacterium]|nr:hypothetical protein [Burkholderiaceae bacterium]